MSFIAENWVESKLREIKTPDMVSLWIPRGDGRVEDIIRGNHGQAIATNRNVNIRPALISPDLGWSMDGVNSYVEIPHDSSITFTDEDFTAGGWIYAEDLSANALFFCKGLVDADGWRLWYFITSRILIFSSYQSGLTQNQPSVVDAILTDKWYFLVVTRSGNIAKIHVNNIDKTAAHVDIVDPDPSTRTLKIGCYDTLSTKLDGNILLPFFAKSAWSQAQISNFYHATKDMFSPLG